MVVSLQGGAPSSGQQTMEPGSGPMAAAGSMNAVASPKAECRPESAATGGAACQSQVPAAYAQPGFMHARARSGGGDNMGPMTHAKRGSCKERTGSHARKACAPPQVAARVAHCTSQPATFLLW